MGVLLYEMLVGVTPFHSFEMKDLIAKINDGRYKLSLKDNEPVQLETCLFLVQCLQMNENDRIPVEELNEHPFIAEQLMDKEMNELDIEEFNNEVSRTSRRYSCYSGSNNTSLMNTSTMTDRFNETVVKETDVVLTTKASD